MEMKDEMESGLLLDGIVRKSVVVLESFARERVVAFWAIGYRE